MAEDLEEDDAPEATSPNVTMKLMTMELSSMAKSRRVLPATTLGAGLGRGVGAGT